MTERPLPPLIQYWHQEPPPRYIDDLLCSFRDRNSDLRHMVFSRAGAVEFIAERFSPREVSAFEACAVPAMQADYLRYCAVFALGGIYSDADFRCVAPLRPLLPDAGRGRLFRGQAGNVINGVFAFGGPGHPFLGAALEIATVNIERRRFDRVYPTTGPPIFMALAWLRAFGSIDSLLERAAATPFGESIEFYCEAIRNLGDVDHTFDGIEISEVSAQDAYIQPPGFPLAYKRSSTHWVGFEGDIFA